MIKKKFTLLIASACLLSGCATQFKDYEGTAKRVALANICERERFISYEAFSNYASFQFGEFAHQWTVDEEKLKSMYLHETEKYANWKPSIQSETEQLRLNCGQIASVAQRVRPGNGAKQQSEPAYQYTPPRTTNCMTTYGWTRCTTN